jgi:hypothetical protein
MLATREPARKEILFGAWDPMNLIPNFSGFRNPIVYETFRGFVHRTPDFKNYKDASCIE